jgi:hypothetical protein
VSLCQIDPTCESNSGIILGGSGDLDYLGFFGGSSINDLDKAKSQGSQQETSKGQQTRERPELPDNTPLPESSRETLGKWFPDLDLTKIRSHTGIPFYVLVFNPEAIAYTEGNDIYYRAGYYNQKSAAGLALTGHELTHVRQEHRYGQGFYRRHYLLNWTFRKALEDEADTMQDLIRDDLRSRGFPP